MTPERLRAAFSAEAWELQRRQHGVVSRTQLLELGLSADAIVHRLATARLHPVAQGIYAVGRPELSRHGRWLAAALSCGPTAVLSHRSAAALWSIRPARGAEIEVTVSTRVRRRRPGIVVHCGALKPSERTSHEGIPVTTVQRTLLDLATTLRGNRRGCKPRHTDRSKHLWGDHPENPSPSQAALGARPVVAVR